MSSIKNWFFATRPHTLTASVAPILIGSGCAWLAQHTQAVSSQNFWLLSLLCLVCAVSLQIAVNLGNDYFDHRSGVDSKRHLRPNSSIIAGKLSITQVGNGTVIALLVGMASGLTLCYLSQPVLILLGLVCVICVWAYSAGPFPLAYNALGELVVFVIFGPIAVIGSYYVQLSRIDSSLWLPSIQMGLYAAAIMLVNNIRDTSSDGAGGKKTLATLWGEARCRFFYKAIMLVALACGLGYFPASGHTAFSSYLIAPATALLLIKLNQRQGAALNQQLAGTAQIMLVAALLLCLDVLWLGEV